MFKNKFQKLISIVLTLAFAGAALPCSAANIVPFIGRNVPVPPSTPVTKIKANPDSANAKNPQGGFSLQAMKSKIYEIISTPIFGKFIFFKCIIS